MKKLFSFIWALVPAQAQAWIIVAVVAAFIGFFARAIYQIDQGGYERCEARHSAAAGKQKDTARGNIIDSGKKYDEIKNTVENTGGPNDLAGPRVTTVLDRLR